MNFLNKPAGNLHAESATAFFSDRRGGVRDYRVSGKGLSSPLVYEPIPPPTPCAVMQLSPFRWVGGRPQDCIVAAVSGSGLTCFLWSAYAFKSPYHYCYSRMVAEPVSLSTFLNLLGFRLRCLSEEYY